MWSDPYSSLAIWIFFSENVRAPWSSSLAISHFFHLPSRPCHIVQLHGSNKIYLRMPPNRVSANRNHSPDIQVCIFTCLLSTPFRTFMGISNATYPKLSSWCSPKELYLLWSSHPDKWPPHGVICSGQIPFS